MNKSISKRRIKLRSENRRKAETILILHVAPLGVRVRRIKIGVLARLIKMMIVDPADGTEFGPSRSVVLEPFQQLKGKHPSDVCSFLEHEGLLQ